MLLKYFNKVYGFFLSDRSKEKFEKIIFLAAISVFVAQIVLVALIYLGITPKSIYSNSEPAPHPISIVYTPFSIILIYEVYLLAYYLPKSIAIYIGKQYEVIALIFVRRIFEELASLPVWADNFRGTDMKQLIFELCGLIVFVLFIFCFYRLSGSKRNRTDENGCNNSVNKRFVVSKKVLSLLLTFLFIVLFINSIYNLFHMPTPNIVNVNYAIKFLNNTFFNIFFTALIFVEVLLLLLMLNINEYFHKIIRNSGFIISTILLKLSFQVEGVENVVIILIATAFGVIMLAIHNLYDKKFTI